MTLLQKCHFIYQMLTLSGVINYFARAFTSFHSLVKSFWTDGEERWSRVRFIESSWRIQHVHAPYFHLLKCSLTVGLLSMRWIFVLAESYETINHSDVCNTEPVA